MTQHLINRLASFSSLEAIPRKELRWLVNHGRYEVHEGGTIIAPKGKHIEHLYVVLSGKITSHIDRGAGSRLVLEWQAGSVTGMLPYSRMSGPPGDNIIDEKSEILAIHIKLFPQMIQQCPSFTGYTVHCMLDRARSFNTSDLQDEKMISLGKLAAGLAHELNNPASATIRGAKLLKAGLVELETVSRALGAAGISTEQFKKIEKLRMACLQMSKNMLPSLQKADHQEKITEWLGRCQLDLELAGPLADTAVDVEALDELAGVLSGDTLGVVLKWIVACCTTEALANDMEHATTQIYKLVEAVKKFTYMDNRAEKELIDVVPGIRDTISILVSKIKSKNALVKVDVDTGLPRVYMNGSELNQVWLSLIDNALDAIPPSGKIYIKGRSRLKRIEISIIDNGSGIAQANLSKIFDPFFTTKAPGQGTGLGLNIARRLLRRHNGDISVQSRPGKTEFLVSLMTADRLNVKDRETIIQPDTNQSI